MRIKPFQRITALTLLFISTFVLHALATTPPPAGALLYFQQDGKIWILLGYDSSYGAWCDFGGRAEPSENPEDTALRELREETRYFYGDSISVTLERFYQSGPYRQYVVEVPYIPESVLLNAPVSSTDAPAREMRAYAWMPLIDLVRNVKAVQPFNKNARIPEQYLPLASLEAENKRPNLILRHELAGTLNGMTENAELIEYLFQLSKCEAEDLHKAMAH